MIAIFLNLINPLQCSQPNENWILLFSFPSSFSWTDEDFNNNNTLSSCITSYLCRLCSSRKWSLKVKKEKFEEVAKSGYFSTFIKRQKEVYSGSSNPDSVSLYFFSSFLFIHLFLFIIYYSNNDNNDNTLPLELNNNLGQSLHLRGHGCHLQSLHGQGVKCHGLAAVDGKTKSKKIFLVVF